MFENPVPVMENETYTLQHTLSNVIKKHEKYVIRGALEHVCMFENPLPVIENETYTLKRTRSIFIGKVNNTSLKKLFIMYVCLKTLCLSWKTKHTRSNMNLRTQLKL